EVSSYQLETIDRFRPNVAAILNVTPDHLGRHGTLAGYADAKARIFMNQQPEHDVAVLNAGDPLVIALETPARVRRLPFSIEAPTGHGLYWDGEALWVDRESFPFSCPVPGRHNVANALAAIAALHGAGLEVSACIEALRSFR